MPGCLLNHMTNLVLLSYGNTVEYRRGVFAVLSFFSFYDSRELPTDVKVIIYTDSDAYFSQYFRGLPVEYVVLSDEQLTEMMGPASFRHRVKALVLGEVLQNHPTDKLLYFDGDTFFIRQPEPLLAHICPGVSVMHTVEFAFDANADAALPNGKAVRDFIAILDGQVFHTTRGEERFLGSQFSWNAGVIGLAPTAAAYMPDVYQFIDYMYPLTHWHIIEQLAFSLILQTRDTMQPAEEYIYHYWEGSKKVAADALLAQAMDHGFVDQPIAEKLRTVRALVDELPKAMQAYLLAHGEIGLREKAILDFNANLFWAGYRAAFRYLLKVPTDKKFVKDVLYHTKRALAARG